ncbi:MAG TPA: hypothetical protein VMT19_06360 [Thermoanaerobaculaceae bacterium]|nr:hypothetical protein [Thermoanaerobaculaceae bacterium]
MARRRVGVRDMQATSSSSQIVIGVHLGTGNAGPAVAMLEGRRLSSPRFILRHVTRLRSRATYGTFAAGVAELVRTQRDGGHDWELILGTASDLHSTLNQLREDLWPLVRTVGTGLSATGITAPDRGLSGWVLAATLRSHFESGELRLAASLLKMREHVDRLLESLLGSDLLLSAGMLQSGSAAVDDRVVSAGLALWWAEQSESRSVLRSESLIPSLASAGDLL